MLSQVAPPLKIDNDCRQVSCHFNKSLFQAETAGQLGLALPSFLGSAVQKRKAEFIAGRYCAHAALAQLDGAPPTTYGGPRSRNATIGVGANREPLWPQGFVGSITHTHGYASAIVAHHSKVRAVGVDSETWIEPDSANNVRQQILTSREDQAEHLHLFESSLHYLTLVFSAKESLFKCLFPLVTRFFDFHAAIIIPQRSATLAGGEFRFELLEDLDAEFRAGYCGHGSYAVRANCVHTAIILKAPARI